MTAFNLYHITQHFFIQSGEMHHRFGSCNGRVRCFPQTYVSSTANLQTQRNFWVYPACLTMSGDTRLEPGLYIIYSSCTWPKQTWFVSNKTQRVLYGRRVFCYTASENLPRKHSLGNVQHCKISLWK